MRQRRTPPAKVRIERKSRRLENGCLQWAGHISASGYASTRDDEGRDRLIHRIMYEVAVGPIPDGYVIDHLCRNRACCEPSHLEAVTFRTNVLRGICPSAVNARKTVCKHGHPFTPENTYVFPASGHRSCRACAVANARRYRDRKLATSSAGASA